MFLGIENLIYVSGNADLIRDFLEEDSASLTPPSSESQVSLITSRYVKYINLTEVKIKLYASDQGITQLNNYGLITEIIYTRAERLAHLEEVEQEIGRDTPPIS